LHDNVNQVLGAARLYIMAAMKETQLHKDNLLDLASTYVMDAIDEIRNLSRHLVKPSLPSGSLVQALNKLNEDLTRVSSACLHLKIHEINENELNEPFKLNLFRVVQEQLNNINKHANAKNIDIHLSSECNEIKLLIADDGKGFDTEKQQTGIGLSNIRSRVKLYEGDMVIISSPGKGCRLQITFPLTKSIIKTK
jgi:signal transduction histidine kinase